MEEMEIKAGMRVKVTQQIAARDRAWTTEVEGTVVSCDRQKAGSWYAHAKGKRLWLDRLTLKKESGEISVLNLDGYSRVEIIPASVRS